MPLTYRWRTFYDFPVFVKTEDWDAAYNGDEAAKRRIAGDLEGVDIYFHAGPNVGDDYTAVTIVDLMCHGIIPRITLHKDE